LQIRKKPILGWFVSLAKDGFVAMNTFPISWLGHGGYGMGHDLIFGAEMREKTGKNPPRSLGNMFLILGHFFLPDGKEFTRNNFGFGQSTSRSNFLSSTSPTISGSLPNISQVLQRTPSDPILGYPFQWTVY
jgi:hypothetical protein